MPSPTCLNCGLKMGRSKTGYILEVMAGVEPYQKWSCDAYECQGCGARVASGYGEQPIAEHWQENFDKWAADGRAWDTIRERDAAREEAKV